MLKRLGCIAVVLTLVFAASMASADTVLLKEDSVANGATVNLTTSFYTGGALAGNYLLSVQNPPGNPAIQYSGYCVDPAFSSNSYATYELVSIAEGSRYEAAAWVLSKGYTNGALSAAEAQVAIWELVWDWGSTFDLSSGNLIASGINATDVQTIYNAALAGIGASFDQSPYVLARHPVGDPTVLGAGLQDFILPNPVPLPPTAMLLGAGLLGIAGLGWRRRKS
jgi:hypothetical protein